MTKLPLNGCKNTLRGLARNCKILRILDQLEQKCLDREAVLSIINDKKLFEANILLINEIKKLKLEINI